MKLIKTMLFTGLFAACTAFVAMPHSAFAGEKEKKCDPAGKVCKEGKDCKVENCKKKEETK